MLCYVQQPQETELHGASWARALGAEPLSLAELSLLASQGDALSCDLVLLDATAQILDAVPPLAALLHRRGSRLVVFVRHSLPTQPAELVSWQRALNAADLCVAPLFATCSEVRAKTGASVVELAPPQPDAAVEEFPEFAASRVLSVVAPAGYARRDLFRELGLISGLVSSLRYRVRVVSSSELAAHRKLIESSAVVYLPSALDDGGALAALCARAGAVLVATRDYGPARLLFPYTTFGSEDASARRGQLFLWLSSSREFSQFFRDDARRRLLHFSPENRREAFLQRLRYAFPEQHFAVEQPSARLSLAERIHHHSGPRSFEYPADQCALVCLVRNGEDHLVSFLGHYRKLGVCHFVFVDNGSDDSTLETLEAQPDVTVYRTDLEHKYYECDMRRLVIEAHCRGRWCLNVDIDELFDFPHSDELGLPGLLRYLQQQGATAMAGYLLDMFARENSFEDAPEGDLRSAYPYYDLSNIEERPYHCGEVAAYADRNELSADHVTCRFGGIRKTLFGNSATGQYLLIKHPLILLDGKLEPVTHPHYSNSARIADVSSVVYHYKFTRSFRRKVDESRVSERYVKFAQKQYERYSARVSGQRGLSIELASAERLRSVDQLVERGFLATSPAYERFVERFAHASRARAQQGRTPGPMRANGDVEIANT